MKATAARAVSSAPPTTRRQFGDALEREEVGERDRRSKGVGACELIGADSIPTKGSARLPRDFKAGTVMPERRSTRCSASQLDTPPPAAQARRRLVPGLSRLEGGLVLAGEIHGGGPKSPRASWCSRPRRPDGARSSPTRATPGRSWSSPTRWRQLPDRPLRARVIPCPCRGARRHPARGSGAGPGLAPTSSWPRGHPGDLRHRHAGADTLRLRNGAARRASSCRPRTVGRRQSRARASVAWESVDHVSSVATPEPFTVAPDGRRDASGGAGRLRREGVAPARLAARGIEVTGLPPSAAAADVRATATRPHRPLARTGRPVADGRPDRGRPRARRGRDRRQGRRSSDLPRSPAPRPRRRRRDASAGRRPPRGQPRRPGGGDRPRGHRCPQPRGRGRRWSRARPGRIPRQPS